MQYDQSPLLQQDFKDKLPIHWAAQFGHEFVIKALLSTGNTTQLQVRDLKGKVALHRASSFGHTGAVQQLLNGGTSEVLIEDDNGALPLHCACFHGHESIIETLLQFHASEQTMAKNWDGTVPLELAARVEMYHGVAALISAGRVDQILEENHFGCSPLGTVCTQGNESLLELMLEGYSSPDDVARIQTHCRGSLPEIFSSFQGRNKVRSLLILARYNIISSKELDLFAGPEDLAVIRSTMNRATKKSATS